MVKRGKVSFSGGLNIFRMSVPGVDVDIATAGQLLLDESVLYPQVVQSFFVPFSTSPVDTALINIGQTPFCYGFPMMAGDGTSNYPCMRWFGGAGYFLSSRAWFEITPTNLRTYFYDPSPASSVISGVRYVTMRRSTG